VSKKAPANCYGKYAESGETQGVGGHDSNLGRWPANLIHDGSDEVVALFPTVASGQPCGIKAGGQDNAFGAYAGGIPVTGFGDTGSAARFFYCAKADREDRNAGVHHLPRKALNWSSGEQSPGTFQAEGTDRMASNHHPTVKPTDLMRYLCRLVTPPGGLILDPFAGSGSTGKAALLEGFQFIGIELDAEYAEIAKARIYATARCLRERWQIDHEPPSSLACVTSTPSVLSYAWPWRKPPGGRNNLLELAQLRHLSIATSSSRLRRYAERGYLESRGRSDNGNRTNT